MQSRPRLSAVDPSALRPALRPRVDGFVHSLVGMTLTGTCPGAAVGDLVEILARAGGSLVGEVIGLRNAQVLVMPLGEPRGIAIGDRLTHLQTSATVACSDSLLGRVVDALGSPIDGRGPIPGPGVHRPLYADPPSPLTRAPIEAPLSVGVRAVDAALTLGQGQRIGIFAGAGVGKSRLLGMMATASTADVNVVALIGERGAEVVDFVETVLPAEARSRTVVVAATSSASALERMRGAFVATAIAEHFCGQGRHVMLVMDSLTRFAMAQRELGLSAGEPAATRGYTPSVFALLPRLLERAGSFRAAGQTHGASVGSITGLYTVLVEGDDMSDPVADAARSILDGHILLDRALADRGHFPAIDVLASISRVADRVASQQQLQIVARLRRALADLREAKELQSIGAFVPGASPGLDHALRVEPAVLAFLQQSLSERAPWPETLKTLVALGEVLQ